MACWPIHVVHNTFVYLFPSTHLTNQQLTPPLVGYWHGFTGVGGEVSTLERSNNRDEERIGFMVQRETSMSKPVLMARRATMPETMTPTTSNVGTSYAMSIEKGELGATEKEVVSWQDVNEDGESEVGEKDVEMAEDLSEPVWGRSKKQARSHSELWPQSRWRSQSWAMQWGMKSVEGHGEGMPTPSNPPPLPKPKYGQAQLAAQTTPPPDPEACGTCINCKVVCTWTEKDMGLSRWPGLSEWSSSFVIISPTTATSRYAVPPIIRPDAPTYTPLPAPPIPPSSTYSPPAMPTPPRLSPVDMSNISLHRQLDNIISRQDQLLSRIDNDCMQVLEHELADCWLDVTTLTHEMEMLRTTGIAFANEDLLDLFRPSNNNTPMDEAEESIAMELHGLVLTATLSTHDISTNQPIQEGSMMGAPVEEESASVVVETQSGVMSAQNDEEDMTEWHHAVGQLWGQHLWNIHGW
ncbi:hypothetical protein EDC04DRAFT_2605958 [Pisolithus marmoratus]|nr:hypothetical protein EDC04DRAFT_2605958 [Pisolithus marmoratus]